MQYIDLGETLKDHLVELTKADFTFLEALDPELTYLFKHVITQEAAYQTLLFSQRRELHRFVAEWYETKYEDGESKDDGENFHPSSSFFPAFGSSLSLCGRCGKGNPLLASGGRSGGKSLRKRGGTSFLYALAVLIPPQQQIELHLHRGSIFEVIGDWDSARDDYFTMLELAGTDQTAQASAHLALGKLGHMRGEC